MSIITGFRASSRFAWRLDPLPLAFVAVGGLGLAAAGILGAAYLHSIAGPGCTPPVTVTCGSEAAFREFDDVVAGRLVFAIGALPFVVGTILGAPLIAREFERRTAAVVWGLSPSRRNWFIWRVAPVLALLLIVLVTLGLAGDRLTGARLPLQDPSRSFADYGMRGPLVVARGLATFAVGVLAGVLLRRVLPALLMTLAFGIVLSFASDTTRTAGIAPTEVGGPATCVRLSCIEYGSMFRSPSGAIMSFGEALRLAGSSGVTGGPLSEDFRAWTRTHGYVEIEVAITGDRYSDVERRELLATSIVTVGVVAAAAAALKRSTVG